VFVAGMVEVLVAPGRYRRVAGHDASLARFFANVYFNPINGVVRRFRLLWEVVVVVLDWDTSGVRRTIVGGDGRAVGRSVRDVPLSTVHLLAIPLFTSSQDCAMDPIAGVVAGIVLRASAPITRLPEDKVDVDCKGRALRLSGSRVLDGKACIGTPVRTVWPCTTDGPRTMSMLLMTGLQFSFGSRRFKISIRYGPTVNSSSSDHVCCATSRWTEDSTSIPGALAALLHAFNASFCVGTSAPSADRNTILEESE
jgi:hypothetical protein